MFGSVRHAAVTVFPNVYGLLAVAEDEQVGLCVRKRRAIGAGQLVHAGEYDARLDTGTLLGAAPILERRRDFGHVRHLLETLVIRTLRHPREQATNMEAIAVARIPGGAERDRLAKQQLALLIHIVWEAQAIALLLDQCTKRIVVIELHLSTPEARNIAALGVLHRIPRRLAQRELVHQGAERPKIDLWVVAQVIQLIVLAAGFRIPLSQRELGD